MAGREAPAKYWCFTLHTYTEAKLSLLQAKADSNFSHLVYQEEKAPSTGKNHIQGFVGCKVKQRLAPLKALLGFADAHLEKAKGSVKDNFNYCTKPESATGRYKFVFGDASDGGSGKRTDLDRVAAAIQSGASASRIGDEFPVSFIKYHKGIEALVQSRASSQAPSARKVRCIVLWGDTGVGKSFWARQFAEDRGQAMYTKPQPGSRSERWFDGYDGESILVLDEFTDQQYAIDHLCQVLDPYKLHVPRKGGFLLAKWDTVIITSNYDPAQWYTDSSGKKDIQWEALQRRLDYVFQCKRVDTVDAPSGPRTVVDVFPTSQDFKFRESVIKKSVPVSAAAGSGAGVGDGPSDESGGGGNEGKAGFSTPPPVRRSVQDGDGGGAFVPRYVPPPLFSPVPVFGFTPSGHLPSLLPEEDKAIASGRGEERKGGDGGLQSGDAMAVGSELPGYEDVGGSLEEASRFSYSSSSSSSESASDQFFDFDLGSSSSSSSSSSDSSCAWPPPPFS